MSFLAERALRCLVNPPVVAVPINCWVCGKPAGDVYWAVTDMTEMKRKIGPCCERHSQ